MESTLLKDDNTHTSFVQLNVYACTACWECINMCPNKAIDKSFLFSANTLINEHVLIYNASKCTGCLNCIQACSFDAISIYKQ
ncbi:MAG: 4Fe-4S binding protein [Bacteroidota bacterium]|nr:4Fe-4S binding protein [Bacteroidota bacterium]